MSENLNMQLNKKLNKKLDMQLNKKPSLKKWRFICLFICVLGPIGCFGNSYNVFPSDNPDGAVPVESSVLDSGTPIIDAVFFDAGGTGGELIDGQVNIFVIDENTLAPIADAKVKIENDIFNMLLGHTDNKGFVHFADSSIKGAIKIDVMANGYVFETIMGLKSVNITIPVKPQTPMPKKTCSISGTISSLDKLPAETNGKEQVALVYFSPSIKDSFSKQNIWPEYPAGGPVVVMPQMDSAFTIEVPQISGVLYVLGGLVNKMNTDDPSDDFYDISVLGTVNNLDVLSSEQIKNVQLSFNVFLTKSASSQAIVLPPVYKFRQENMGLDLGEDGVVWFKRIPTSSYTLFKVPDEVDSFFKPSVVMVAKGTSSDSAPQQRGTADSDWVSFYPKAFKIVQNAADNFNEFFTDPYVFDSLPSPPQSLQWDGSKLTYLPVLGYHFGEVLFLQASDETPLWRVTALGDLPSEISHPTVPSDWKWNPVPAQDVICRVWTARLNAGADANQMMFNDFSSLVKDVALNARRFTRAR